MEQVIEKIKEFFKTSDGCKKVSNLLYLYFGKDYKIIDLNYAHYLYDAGTLNEYLETL